MTVQTLRRVGKLPVRWGKKPAIPAINEKVSRKYSNLLISIVNKAALNKSALDKDASYHFDELLGFC
jgi:hypothetical protein